MQLDLIDNQTVFILNMLFSIFVLSSFGAVAVELAISIFRDSKDI
jgi:hypothetical protein